MIPLIFLDTETTGLRPDYHDPWEVAWTTCLHDPETKTLTKMSSNAVVIRLTEREIERADPVALRIGRFDERYKPWAEPNDVAEYLAYACQAISFLANTTDVPHLVGAVPSFDHAMLCSNILGWPDYGQGLWHYHLIDVEVLAAGRIEIPPPYDSSQLTALCEVVVDEDTKHTEAGDVEWALQVYAAVYGLTVIG